MSPQSDEDNEDSGVVAGTEFERLELELSKESYRRQLDSNDLRDLRQEVRGARQDIRVLDRRMRAMEQRLMHRFDEFEAAVLKILEERN